MLMADASRIWKIVKSNLLRVYDVDLPGLCYDFSQQLSSLVGSTAGCFVTFRRDQLLQLLNSHHTISAVTALQATAQFEVACAIFCVLRDEHLSIDRPDRVRRVLVKWRLDLMKETEMVFGNFEGKDVRSESLTAEHF